MPWFAVNTRQLLCLCCIADSLLKSQQVFSTCPQLCLRGKNWFDQKLYSYRSEDCIFGKSSMLINSYYRNNVTISNMHTYIHTYIQMTTRLGRVWLVSRPEYLISVHFVVSFVLRSKYLVTALKKTTFFKAISMRQPIIITLHKITAY